MPPLSSVVAKVRGLWGRTGPCTASGCSGLAVELLHAVADGADADGNYVLEAKTASWLLTQIAGQPGDEWVALSGAGPDVWAVGTVGLVAHRSATGWTATVVGGGPPPVDVDWTGVDVVAGRVYAIARRVTQVGNGGVDLFLVTWTPDAPGDARWLKLSTHACTSTDCAASGGDPADTLTGVVVAGNGLYVVGTEQIGGTLQAVVYHRPLPN